MAVHLLLKTVLFYFSFIEIFCRSREAQRLTNEWSSKSYSSVNLDIADDESQDEHGPPRTYSSGTLVEEAPGEFMKIRSMLTDKKMNLMLVFVPAGFVVNYCRFSDTTIFVVNFLAMMVSGGGGLGVGVGLGVR